MSNELIIFENKEFGKVRTVLINDEHWFVGKDVTGILGYLNNNRAIKRHVDEDDRQKYRNGIFKAPRGTLLINESGMYSLILRSKLPTAKKFKCWITSEIIPAIRDTCGYTADSSRSFRQKRDDSHKILNINNVQGEINMNEVQVFTDASFGTIRTLMIDNEPWFVGKDVAAVLGYADNNKAIAMHVDNEDKKLNDKSSSSFGQRGATLINESGLYSLILSSKLPTAKKFKHWITSEVLPAIRKHGAYMTPEKIEEALLNPDTLIKLATELKAEREARKNAELEAASAKQVIGELKPKADYTDLILSSNDTVPITVIAKDYGMSAKVFNEKLHELHVIYKLREQWLLYAKYQNKGYTHSKTFHFTRHSGLPACRMQTEWTQKGRLFLYQLLKKHSIIPMIERDDTDAEDLEKMR